jgi:hypothetical protein
MATLLVLETLRGEEGWRRSGVQIAHHIACSFNTGTARTTNSSYTIPPILKTQRPTDKRRLHL